VYVNHIGYQRIVDLSAPFLARHPHLLKESPDENPYNLPFRFAKPSPNVMIVGSGTGNDVAAALRHDSPSVDAVEIDPAIVALGKREHPEHPYDSSRVSLHLNDARAFLKRTERRYDLVLFGLLDSHTQFSDYSNMRIDNFVYTEESFREAKRRLLPGGIVFVKFQVNHPWMARRLSDMLEHVFGKRPVVFQAESSFTASATCFVISPSSRVEEALAEDAPLTAFVEKNGVVLQAAHVPFTTDDWPYLYQEGRWIPRTYFSVGVLVILLAFGLYLQIPEARRQVPSLFFFIMGAGFLLLETQVISRLALYFGTTWEVNGIVISALLTALLAANIVIERMKKVLPRYWVLAGLLAGLVFAYVVPFDRVPGQPTLVGALVAAVFSVPVFFAGLLFSLEFRTAMSPGAALGANVLGAVAGGLLENLSLLIGLHALLLVTVGLYAIAGIGLWIRRPSTVDGPQPKEGIELT
jgi:spermidine synthase